MKRIPVLKFEESEPDGSGYKFYELKLNGKVIRKDYNYSDFSKAYHSDDNYESEPAVTISQVGAIACKDFPDRVELSVKLNLVLFNSETCSVDILRKGSKLHLTYDVCFAAEANKSFIWSAYWFTIFLREHFTARPYKLPEQPDPEETEGEVVVTVERTVLCEGTISERLKDDMKYFAEAVEKTHRRMLAEARKFKDLSSSVKPGKRKKDRQISGNSADYPAILPSASTNSTS